MIPRTTAAVPAVKNGIEGKAIPKARLLVLKRAQRPTACTEYWHRRAPPTIVAPMAKGQVSKGKDNKEKLSIKEKKEKKKEKAANKKR